ncbi:hypothetical protein EYF80_046575 [Liparis tanakae]|uniref:Uncharacterized protein n=1 Tax=Liparis tanakae TaxID=230148 RepID=A0A4Z2FQ23_9TELE|nr:hypothetical protein EYF80_046575 [Liparis tanakae]
MSRPSASRCSTAEKPWASSAWSPENWAKNSLWSHDRADTCGREERESASSFQRLLRWNWSTFSSNSLNWIPDSWRKFFFTSWTLSVETKDLFLKPGAPLRGASWLWDLSFLHSDTTSRMALKWKSMRLSMAGSVTCPPSWKRSQRSPSLRILMPICKRTSLSEELRAEGATSLWPLQLLIRD